MTKTNTHRLVESGILIAIAVVLVLISSILPLSLPFGGSITFMSMLPIILISYRYGIKWGLFCGFVFSIIQMLTGFKTVSAFFIPGDSQVILWKAIAICFLDYVLAFTVIGLGGLFRNKFKSPMVALVLGTVFALLLRFAIHFISGSLFFGAWAEWFFTQEAIAQFGTWVLAHISGTSLSMFYSFIYNATYMIPEIIITVVGAIVISKIPSISKKMDYKVCLDGPSISK
ncbi:MAG: energy-coupled thiamine transporter ThiT [Oscillospiraceae bacterium]